MYNTLRFMIFSRCREINALSCSNLSGMGVKIKNNRMSSYFAKTYYILIYVQKYDKNDMSTRIFSSYIYDKMTHFVLMIHDKIS